MTQNAPGTTGFRSGFACLVGRPNAGKSTLTNALVGEKVAITSSRPQTTRHTIRGIVHRSDAQLVLVDTPGLHKPRTLLGERLNDLVRETLLEVDVIGFCIAADQAVGPGDKFIAAELAELRRLRRRRPVVAIVTKTDAVQGQLVAEQLLAVSRLVDADDIVPVSAKEGFQVDRLTDVLVGHLPEGPPLYPDGELTDEPEIVMIAELVREAALEGRPGRAAAQPRRRRRGDDPARGPPRARPAPRRLRPRLRRARVAEGDRHRQGRLPAA